MHDRHIERAACVSNRTVTSADDCYTVATIDHPFDRNVVIEVRVNLSEEEFRFLEGLEDSAPWDLRTLP
jgi:hypothetical protein